MRKSHSFSLLLFVIIASSAMAQTRVKPKIVRVPYVPPRPAIAGLHVGQSQDSAFLVMKTIALRRDTLRIDSLILLESDSVQIFGQPAYVQVQIARKRVKTLVINFHPLSGDRYLNTRNQLIAYLEKPFGRGVVTQQESVTHHRWETDDGTMEVSHSDKYTRVFVRLGKPRI
jgi:hypothetical protein